SMPCFRMSPTTFARRSTSSSGDHTKSATDRSVVAYSPAAVSDAENRSDRLIRANIDALLKAHNSPLEGCGGYFWVLGRFWGIDGRLAAGIARAETSFAPAPHMPPADLPGPPPGAP